MKKLYKPRINMIRLAAAAVCAVLLLPLFTSCTITLSPNTGDSDTGDTGYVTKAENTNPSPGNDGGFTFDKTSYSSGYLIPGLPDALQTVNITADKISGSYALPDTAFTVETASEISTDELKKHINITPAVSFDLTKKTGTTFSVTPSAPLESGTLYCLTVGNVSHPQSSFVFQTDSALVIKSVLPADLAISVPTNTGIEICFSEPPTPGIEIGDYFYITPAAEGEYMTYPDGKTVVFVPKNHLNGNTVYYINVKQGLPSVSGKSLTTAFTSAFRTASVTAAEANSEVMFSLESYEPQFTTAETPVINYFYTTWDRSGKFTLNGAKVTLYRYASVADVISAMKVYESVKADYLYGGEPYVFPSDGLGEAGSYDITPGTAEGGNYQYSGYLTLPMVGEGVYLVNITFRSVDGGEKKEYFCQAVMQISDLIVYTEASGANMLVWVNDASTGKTVSSAAVTAELFTRNDYWNLKSVGATPAYVTKTSVTGDDGLCFLETGGASNAYVTVKKDGHSLYVGASLYSYGISQVKNDGHSLYVGASPYSYGSGQGWFSCLFSDRETYFSNDTVNFWGIIAPKNGSMTLPDTIYLTLDTSKTADKITVRPDGSFSGSFVVEDYAGYGIYMNLTDSGGSTICAKYITITQQSKPVYRAALSFDKLFYMFGDTVTLTLTATFYDGTPAPDLEFTLYGSQFIPEKVTIKTGSDGTVKYSYKTSSYIFYSSYPAQLSAEARLIGNEGTSLSVSAYVPYFHSRVRLQESRIIPEDGGDTYTELYLNYTDTSALKTKDDLEYPLYPDNTIGAAAQGSVKVRLIEYKYAKEYASTTYDPVTKTSQKNYTYRLEQRDIKSYTAQFVNGVIRLDHIKPAEEFNGYYMYDVSYYDADNKCSYNLQIYANAGDGVSNYYDGNDYYELTSDKSKCNVGDTVTATLNYGKKPVDSGRILFTVYSDRLDLYSSTEKSNFALVFEDKDAAGLEVCAAHFDGRHVRTAGELYLSYNYTENNLLNINITPDKTAYKPGETAKVTVAVTDAGGNPVTGGVVTLSMVDEACFALGEQTLAPLETYYGGGGVIPYICRDARFSCFGTNNIYNGGRVYGAVETASAAAPSAAAPSADTAHDSSKNPQAAPSASVTVREIFKDNPLFQTYAVSKNGTAEIAVTVPDNITEWRFTALAAYNPDRSKISGMNLGSAATGVICTLPFFADVTLSDTYIEGDDIAGHVRVYGSALEAGSAVNYTVQLIDSDSTAVREIKLNGNAGKFARFNFGSYKSGSYNITVKAVCGEMSDGVSLPVEITPSGIMMNIRREINPTGIGSLNPMMYPVYLTFNDSSYDSFFTLCRSLMKGTSRSDALAAYYVSASVSETLSGTRQYVTDALDEIKSTLSGYTGMIPLLSYSQADIRLTAKICAIAPDALTGAKKTELAGLFADYIQKRSYTDDADMCAAYLGLAALGRPVLDELYFIAENSGNFSVEAKLYLAAAFAYIGDYSAASEYYGYIMATESKINENELFISSDNTEDSIMLTALALITASVVDTAGAGRMVNYLSTHISTVNLYDLELAAYVRFFFPTGVKESAFTYSIGDVTQQITLSPGECYNLTLNRRDFESFKLLSSDETVRVHAAYCGSAEEAFGSGDITDKLEIKKTIEPYDTARGLYKVTLSYRAVTDRSYAYFTLSDCIPSGARYFGASQENGDLYDNNVYTFAYINNSGGQVMNGCIGLYNRTEKAISGLTERTIEGSVSYIIRAAFEGSFVVENAVVQNINTGSYAVSKRGSVVIDNNGWTVEY